MTRHWKIGFATIVALAIGFGVALALNHVVGFYVLLMVGVVLGFALGTAWIVTQRTFSPEGDEATEWRGPAETKPPEHSR